MSDTVNIKKPTGKFGILMPGLGAVATTFIAGVMAIREGIARPLGSLTQMGTTMPRRKGLRILTLRITKCCLTMRPEWLC